MNGIGQRIADRRGKGTQAWLAERCGVTQTAVSYWEADKRVPDLEMVPKIAQALGCDPGWLAFGTPPMRAPGAWFVEADGADGVALYGPFGDETEARTFAARLIVQWPPQIGESRIRWTTVAIRQATSPESQL